MLLALDSHFPSSGLHVSSQHTVVVSCFNTYGSHTNYTVSV